MAYDPDNVFARILSGEVPCRKVVETAHSLAFHDVHPQAAVHVLVIPKGSYATLEDFCREADAEEVADWVQTVARVAELLEITESGYRVLANTGRDAHQEVPHLHMHVFGGGDLGRMIRSP